MTKTTAFLRSFTALKNKIEYLAINGAINDTSAQQYEKILNDITDFYNEITSEIDLISFENHVLRTQLEAQQNKEFEKLQTLANNLLLTNEIKFIYAKTRKNNT